MKIEELKQGLERILDAANEKLNALCEQVGIEPDDPVLTEEEDTETESGEGGEEGASEKEGENGAASAGDENTIPTPENIEGGEGIPQNGADMAAAQAGIEGGAAPATEIPPEAQQMAGAEGDAAGIPGVEAAEQGGGGMTPDEEELLKQQQAASAQQ